MRLKITQQLLACLLLFGFGYSASAQCPAGQVPITIEIDTDDWGYETYWQLQPSGTACGASPLLEGGNITQVGCAGGGAQVATIGNGYADNATITSAQICLTDGANYDLHYVDDFGDGGATFRIIGAGGVILQSFAGMGTGNTFTFTATAPPAVDAIIDSVSVGEYTRMPYTQIAAVPLAAKLTNGGTTTISGATITAEIFEAGNTTPIFTATSASTTVAVGASSVVSVGSWTPPASPFTTYTIEYSTNTIAGDANPANNSLSGDMAVTARTYSRDDGNQVGGLGSNAGGIRQASSFDILNAENLYSVDVSFNGGLAGDTVFLEVYNTDASGTPTTVIGSSTPTILTGPGTGFANFAFPAPIALSPGEYAVSLYHSASTSNISLSYSDNIFAPGKAWLKIGTGAWQNPENQGFNIAFFIRPLFTPLLDDLAITSVTNPHPEYTIIPETQYTGTLTAEAEVTNNGSSVASNVVLTTEIYSASNLTTPLLTLTSSPLTSLAPGASTTITTGTYTPTTPDSYIFEHSVSFGATDQNPADNIGSTFFILSEGTYARDNGDPTGSLGVGANATPGVYDNAILGQNFELINDGRIDSVTALFNAPTPGDSVRIAVYNTASGTPSAEIGFTDAYTFVPADTNGVLLTLPITGAPLNLTAGTYFVGVREYNENITLATTPNIFTTGTTWLQWDGNPNGATAWSNNESFAFNVSYVLRPNVLFSCNGLTATTVTTDATCTSADGSANVTASGAAAPYSYAWSNGATTSGINSVVAGSYTVTVTGSTGCTTTATATVNATASPVTLTTSSTNASCGSNNGSVTVTAANGNMPYTYLWNNGATSSTVTGLGSGAYSVTVTDANGCQATASETVVVPNGPTATAVVTNVTCNGGTTGAINATVVGGATPYTFSWSNGATTEDLTGLTAGTYSGTITDDNSCTFSVNNVVISEPTAISLSANTTNVSCAGAADGAVDITVTGGMMPYSYSWSNGATTQDLSGLSGGVFSGTITDDNGCTASASVTITEPSAISVTANSSDVTCNGDADGSIDISVSGGTMPYSYSWSNGATTEDLSGLSGGVFSGTITDNNGCTASASITVTEPNALSVSANVTNISCNGDADGAIDATVTGGTMPYSYSWSNGATTEDISGLTANTYVGLVTDNNSCTVSATVTITEPAALTASTTVTDVSSNGGNDGTIDVTPTGGTMPYTYNWSTGDTGASLTGLTAGTYDVTITDDNGCTFSISETVTEPPVSTTTAELPYGLQIFPNPTKGLVNLDFELNQASEVHIQVFSATGQLLRDLHRANIQNEQWQLDISEYPSGVYFLQINAGGHISGHRVILQD